MVDLTQIDAIRAIEALRSGVPSTHAVRALGCVQTAIEARFEAQLRALAGDGEPSGTLVAGGFGSGKSHLLAHLQAHALRQGFVVSRVSISKETPLFDLGRVFRSAVDAALVPNATGRAIQEVALKLKPQSDAYAALQRWSSGASDFFAATLAVFEAAQTSPEMRERIIDFWSGDKLPVADLRLALRQANLQSAFVGLRNPKLAELAHLRFAFAARLFRAAGCKGWVLLLDELELIGRYSQLQRARSYAELARWFGVADKASVHWIAAVAAITDEFDFAVLQEKDDMTALPNLLRRKALDALVERTERGMRLIRSDVLRLATPSQDDVRALYDNLAMVYAHAYGVPPTQQFSSFAAHSTPMRTYVRKWITAWDLQRLDPGYAVEIETGDVQVPFGEDLDLESADA